MKVIISTLIFLLVYLPIGGLSYVFLDEFFFLLFNALGLLVWFVVYIHIDRILLVFLGAREVIDTDEYKFFQILKNNSYKNRLNLPRVYLYSGTGNSCFLFESLKDWILVLDRSFLEKLSPESTEKLVEFFYAYHRKEGRGYLKTKALGVCVLFYTSIYWLLKKLFFNRVESKFFKSFATFVIIMSRPFLLPFEFILRTKSSSVVSSILEQYSVDLNSGESFSNYLTGLVVEDTQFGHLIVRYMEGYPLLADCEFKHEC